jgi:hypothetical protein
MVPFMSTKEARSKKSSVPPVRAVLRSATREAGPGKAKEAEQRETRNKQTARTTARRMMAPQDRRIPERLYAKRGRRVRGTLK